MLHESGEDYLETILVLKRKQGHVRSVDIANELGYTKASVSRAMSILKQSEYIYMDKGNFIQFTDKGLVTANEILERHDIIKNFLYKTLGVSEDVADKDACKIEHIISEETFKKIKKFHCK